MSAPHRSRPVRVLVAKPGLDGHDVGAKIVCRVLRDAGCEVIYTGLRQSPAAIAEVALEENVDVLGLSILSGAHLPLCRKVMAALADIGLADLPVLVGGAIPRADHEALCSAGVTAVLPTGTSFESIAETVRQAARS